MVANEMPKLLTVASLQARANKKRYEGSDELADLFMFAFWDGVKQMSRVTLDVGTGSITADAAVGYLMAYGAGIRSAMSGEGEGNGQEDSNPDS